MRTALTSGIFALAMSSLAQTSRPVVIAHRGASGYLPEHTLESKAMAHAMGADFIEQDIVLTKDDVPIVLHDIHLETTCDVARVFADRKRADGHYYALDFTLPEIRQLRAHERINPKTGEAAFPKRFPVGRAAFAIPTLEEELQLIVGLNQSTGRVAGIYPEIKKPGWHREQGHDISRIVLPILRRHGYATKSDACWVQCFEWDEVQRIRAELGWEGRLLLLLDGKKPAPGMSDIAQFADGIGPALSAIVTADRAVTDLVKRAHAAKLLVHPYTLRADELPEFAKSMDDALDAIFREAGVDGLFTDFPDLAVRWLAAHGTR